VGKTTLAFEIAKSRSSLCLYLEQATDRAKLADPEYFLGQHADKLVILDEIQRTPALFETLRGLIDQGRRTGHGRGRFLLLGSASLGLSPKVSRGLHNARADLSPDRTLVVYSGTEHLALTKVIEAIGLRDLAREHPAQGLAGG
jgi:predicted AAA+ superfamily ATPase